jgi:hypothetical protein
MLKKKKKPSQRKKRSKQAFDQPKEVRAIARERVGPVKSSRVIVPKAERPKLDRKAKHKVPPGEDES